MFAESQTLHSPLALAGMENQVLVVLGADGELVLRRVEDVEQQVTVTSAAWTQRQEVTVQSAPR